MKQRPIRKFIGATPRLKRKNEVIESQTFIPVPDEVMRICQEISNRGGQALIVGGSVRDFLISREIPELGVKPKDFDIEVYGLPTDRLEKILEEVFGISNIDAVGKQFGIYKVRIDGWDEPLDFSIPRRDSKTGEGHKGFSVQGDPSMSIVEAGFRRDITLNSISYSPLTGTMYDVYHGFKDIQRRRIDVIDPNKFSEDPLRVLRVMQFASRFIFEVSDRTVILCRKMVTNGELDSLPRERILEEVKKLFTKGKKPSIGLEFIRQIGLIERYWPEVGALVGVPQEKDWHPEGDVWTHTLQVVDAAVEIADREIKLGKMQKEDKLVLVVAALCHDLGKPATTEFIDGAYRARGHEPAGVVPTREFLERIFGDSKSREISEITKKVLPLVAEHLKPKELWENEVKKGIDQTSAIRRLAKRLSDGDSKTYADGGDSSIYMLSLVTEADQRGRNGEDTNFLQRTQVPELEEWQSWLLHRSTELKVEQKPPEMLLTGRLFLQASKGLKGGVWLGVVLESVYEDQLEGKFDSIEEAIDLGHRYYQSFTQKVKELALLKSKSEKEIWEEIKKLEDPRSILVS